MRGACLGADFPLPPGQEPRKWQPEALAAFRQAAQEKRRKVIASVATGGGKGSAIAAMAILTERKQRRSVIATWRDELVDDLFKRVVAAGGHAGRVQADHDDWSQPIVVASVQSLHRRLDQLRRFSPSVLHADEGHHWTSPTSRAVIDAHPWSLVAGWTATPFRSAGKGETEGLGDVFEACIFEYPIVRAIADGVLVPIEGRRLPLTVNLDGVDMGDEESLAARFDIAEINATIAADYHKHHAGLPAVYFCANIAHAVHLAAAFGSRAQAVWGDDPDRAAKLADYEAGRLDILCCRDLLTEGWDSPRTTVIGLACPISSVIRYVQCIGRGTRLYPGKTKCWVVDCVGTTETMPYVTWADLSKTMAKAEKDIAKRAKKREEKALKEGAIVAAAQSYEVFILGGSTEKRLGVGWYEMMGSYVAGAKRWGTDLNVQVLIERDGPEWVAFSIVSGKVRDLGRFPSLDGASAAGVAVFEAFRLKPAAIDADWRKNPASPAQIAGLKAWKIRRDLTTISKGEASMLMDAVIARRVLRAWQKEQTA
jgi:superfamily II DNA or RNA helicase